MTISFYVYVGTFDVYSAAMQAVNDDLEDNSSVQVTMGVYNILKMINGIILSHLFFGFPLN